MTTHAIDLLADELPSTCSAAAHWWYEFGFTVAPLDMGTKKTALRWAAWTQRLKDKGHDAIDAEFSKKDYGLCAIVDDEVFIMDADGPEATAALYTLEASFNLAPNLVVTTKKGEHHYFRRAPGTFAKMDSFSSEKHPNKLDIRTGRSETEGRSVIVLPPSPGKVIGVNEANSIADLVEVGQDFIDAVFRHNGREAPRAMPERTAPEVTRITSASEAQEILSWIPPDIGYQDWVTVLMGTHSKFMGADEGLYLVDEWSAGASNYCGFEELEYKWRSFTDSKKTTWGSVCDLARQHGADLSAIANRYNPDGSKRREYSEILADAQAMDRDSDPDAIQALVEECRPLAAIQRRKVFDAIKKTTGMPLSDLKAAMHENTESGSGELDQLSLAELVIDGIGRDNLLSAQSFVYQWDDAGVWRKQEDRAVKQLVQTQIKSKVDAVGKTLVDGVTDLLKNTIYKDSHQFDIGPPETVNCINGELSRIDGQWKLHPHDRQHYRTTQLPIAYDPQATAPRFMQFLLEVFKQDHDADDKVQAVLEMMGYSLMGHCKHEKFIILIGSGANGKSVLMSVMESLTGRENVAAVQPSEFANKFQRAHLHGKLVNIVSELKQGAVIDDEALKGITSGEGTTVEHKHRDPFVMHPFSTCWFGTNHMPHTRDFSDALFRRALLIEFNNVFKPELRNCDPNLKSTLMDELPGILNMVLTAYGSAIDDGFTVPCSMRTALDRWRLEADQVAQFVDEECVLSSANKEPSGVLFKRYQDWATENGIKQQVNTRSFKERLQRLGVVWVKDRSGRHFIGIKCESVA